jgi:hypothetical protein
LTEPLPVSDEAAEIGAIVARMEEYFIPGRMFHSAYHDLVFKGYATYEDGFLLSGITRYSETEEVARDRAYSDRCKELLPRHAGFVALQKRYATIAIEGRFLNHGEYHGAWNTFAFLVRNEHLPALERMAQDDIGLRTDTERKRAAEDFRTYFLQHYDADHERYRRELPLIERTPYRMLNDPDLPKR